MTSTFLLLSLTAVVVFILWIVLKPKKKQTKKKIRLKNKAALKNKTLSKKEESIDSISNQIRRKKTAQIKKDPETISQVVKFWLKEK